MTERRKSIFLLQVSLSSSSISCCWASAPQVVDVVVVVVVVAAGAVPWASSTSPLQGTELWTPEYPLEIWAASPLSPWLGWTLLPSSTSRRADLGFLTRSPFSLQSSPLLQSETSFLEVRGSVSLLVAFFSIFFLRFVLVTGRQAAPQGPFGVCLPTPLFPALLEFLFHT